MTINQIKIRKCKLSDIESIRYLQPDGWGDITFYFRFYCSHSFCHPIVALDNDRIVGVATGILNKKTGWLAHIIVSEAHRGKGIGYQLTQHVINYLHQHGCETLLLIATELGEPIYRKCGFETVTEYQFYKGNQIHLDTISENIRNLLPSDRSLVFALDESVTGEYRKRMLEQFLINGWVYGTDSKIRGFYLPEFGEGTIIALDDASGLELLKFKLRHGKNKVVLPKENQKGIQFVESFGFEKFNRAKRMALGKSIQWNPELIYSRAGGFYG